MTGTLGKGERRRRRRRADPLDRGPSQHRWIVSYADFITLLFAFFTTLYAISSVDARKIGPLAAGFHTAFAGGGADHAAATTRPAALRAPAARQLSSAAGRMLDASPQPVADPRAASGAAEVTLDEVRKELSDRLAGPARDGRVAVDLDRRGLVVSIRESGSFATGSAEISQQARQIVGEVATAVRDIGNLVRVEGHTDDVPIHTPRYDSNWELSTARATNVVALLTQEYPDRRQPAFGGRLLGVPSPGTERLGGKSRAQSPSGHRHSESRHQSPGGARPFRVIPARPTALTTRFGKKRMMRPAAKLAACRSSCTAMCRFGGRRGVRRVAGSSFGVSFPCCWSSGSSPSSPAWWVASRGKEASSRPSASRPSS